MEKVISTIEEWLQDCGGSSGAESEYFNSCFENDEDRLIHSIFSLFDEKTRYPELFDSTVKQLFVLARSKDEKQKDFVLLFVPSLIYMYLSAISMGDKKSVSSIEITLVSLYNTEVLSEKGVAEIASFRLPTLARQSIYHEPSSLAPTSFTPDSLHRLESGDTESVRWGPPKHMTTVTAATRYHLATALLVAFNARLSKFPKIVLVHLCRATSKLVCQGFSRPGHHHRSSYGSDGNFGVYPRPVPRIPVTSDLLAELVHAVYFAIPSRRSLHDLPSLVSLQMALSMYHYNRFNDFVSIGAQTLEDVHMRAQYELFSDVLLMTNAIKNSLKVNSTSQPSDGPMGISIALTPSTSAAPLSKTYITNASFRTKKLPDDIPIQHSESIAEGSKGLKSISEDQDAEDKESGKPIRTPQGSGREAKDKEGKEKMKLSSNLPNLVKKRDKEKYKNGEKKDSDKKVDKERRLKQDKENRSEAFMNRNSVNLSGDMSLSPSVPDGLLKQTSPQQHIEMKTIPRIEDKLEEQLENSNPVKNSELNGGQNQIGKVS